MQKVKSMRQIDIVFLYLISSCCRVIEYCFQKAYNVFVHPSSSLPCIEQLELSVFPVPVGEKSISRMAGMVIDVLTH